MRRIVWLTGIALLIATIAAGSVSAAKPPSSKVTAGVCHQTSGVDGRAEVWTSYAYTGIHNATIVREYGSTDGGASWTLFDGRGATGASGSNVMNFEAAYWDDIAGYTLVKVQVENEPKGKVLAVSASVAVSVPVAGNPACQ